MFMKEIDKIYNILKDFKPFQPRFDDKSKFVNVITGIYNPPAYIVQILLLGILELENYGRMDKVLWHTYFLYKGYPFMIRDYKFDTWTIEGIKRDEEIIQLAKEIQNKIIKASKVLDKILYNELKSEIENGNFYLHNLYHKLYSIYCFYEEKFLETIKEYEEFEKEKGKHITIHNLVDIWNTRLKFEKEISKYSFALILSFFSLLEFLLDVFYAFEQPNMEFFEFRKKKWHNRFKIVFTISKNEKLKRLYDKLVDIKRNYRNPLAHGLRSEVTLLVQLPYIGLVPLSYEYFSQKIYYGIAEIGKNDALKIINTFQSFLDFLKNKEPYRFYMLYLDYGFAVPMNEQEVLKIKEKMTTYEEFKEYLDKEAFYQDLLINRDI